MIILLATYGLTNESTNYICYRHSDTDFCIAVTVFFPNLEAGPVDGLGIMDAILHTLLSHAKNETVFFAKLLYCSFSACQALAKNRIPLTLHRAQRSTS